VAVSSSILAIGSSAGKAFSYNFDGTLRAELINPGSSTLFGDAIDASDSYIVVGCVDVDTVYVFLPDGELFSTIGGLIDTDFGRSVSISSSRLEIGALDLFNEGAAFVYDTADFSSLLFQLDNSSGIVGFGLVLALSDDVIVVGGEPNQNVATFRPSDGSLISVLEGDASNVGFGQSVSIYQIGIFISDPGDQNNIGRVWVYLFDNGGMVLQFTVLAPIFYGTNTFGQGLAGGFPLFYVGEPITTDENGVETSGKVHLFDASTGGTLVSTFSANPAFESNDNRFGESVSLLENSRLAIGIPGANAFNLQRLCPEE